MPGQEIDLSKLTVAAAVHLAHHLRAGPESFLDEPESLVVAFGLRIGLAKESDGGPAHAAPGSRQIETAFQLRDGMVEITLENVEAPQGVGRDDGVELVTARFGNPDRLLSERDSFDELTKVAEGQRQPGPRSDEDRGWAQSQPQTLSLRGEPVEGQKAVLATRGSRI